jgi:hypothetical protein
MYNAYPCDPTAGIAPAGHAVDVMQESGSEGL